MDGTSLENDVNHEPDLCLCLCRRDSLGQSKVCLCSKVRMAGGEEFAVNGKGDRLLIEPPRRTIGLGRREITLLERLHRIVSVLNSKPEWSEREWKSIVDVALSECVDCFELRFGPSGVDHTHEKTCKMHQCNGGLPSFF